MKIHRVELLPLHFNLRPAVMLAGNAHTTRDGLLVKISSRDGLVGWGECSPLPGFSRETLQDAKDAAATCAAELAECEIDLSALTNCSALADMLGMADAPSSVRFAFECALLSMAAQSQGTEPERVLCGSTPQPRINVNALIVETDENLREAVEKLCGEGFKAIKVKVGRQTVDQDIAMLKTLVGAVHGRVDIRLDANRLWDREQAVQVLRAFEEGTFEYVEEPIADMQEFSTLRRLISTPIALDESLQHLSPEQLDAFDFAHSIVIKPTLIGGLCRSWAWHQAAERLGIKTVVSSSFESGLGMLYLIRLAAAMQIGESCMGFDTYHWIERDILKERIAMNHDVEMARLPKAEPRGDVHGND